MNGLRTHHILAALIAMLVTAALLANYYLW
jgi:hypothetical protein